jgi:hypothetical protein|tara:strand:- start:5258 stop:5710 length:453 start_codon:yes stop_codon:yes gene_type:complete
MVKIVQDLYVTELTISNVSNAPFTIDAVGSYPNKLIVTEEILQSWGIEPDRTLIGKNLVITLEPLDESKDDINSLQIDHLEKVTRRRYRYLSEPSFLEELEFVLSCNSPRVKSEPNPCPNYHLKLSIKESDYQELYELSSNMLKLSCQIK